MEVLQVKDDDDFHEKIVETFKFLSIGKKYRLAGSSLMKPILYNTDFDLQERVTKKGVGLTNYLKHMAEVFKEKFRAASKDPNVYITDFKCGVDSFYDPEKQREKYILRWNKEDMKKGYKVVHGGRRRHLWECLLDKTTLKLDIVVLINNIFEEFSEIYFIDIDGHKNYDETTKEDICKSIYDNYLKYTREGMPYKGLKRLYSVYKMNPKRHLRAIQNLTNFFNTESGLIYKNKSQLGVLTEILKQKFREPDIQAVKNNLEIVKQSLGYVYKIDMKKDIPKVIEAITRLTSKALMISRMEKLEEYLQSVINKEAIKFKKNNRIT